VAWRRWGRRRRVGRSCLEWRVRLARGTRERRGRRAAMVRRCSDERRYLTVHVSIEVEVEHGRRLLSAKSIKRDLSAGMRRAHNSACFSRTKTLQALLPHRNYDNLRPQHQHPTADETLDHRHHHPHPPSYHPPYPPPATAKMREIVRLHCPLAFTRAPRLPVHNEGIIWLTSDMCAGPPSNRPMRMCSPTSDTKSM